MVMFNRNRRGGAKGFKPKTKKAAKAAAVSRSLTPLQKIEVKKLVKAPAETKLVAWYGGDANPFYGTLGAQSGWNWQVRNGQILNNITDIQRVIPAVKQGTNDNQRIGSEISPVSLIVNGHLALINSDSQDQLLTPANVYAVVYVLQHVALKTYQSLVTSYDTSTPPVIIGGNDFTKMLKTAEGTTTGFVGYAWQSHLPVADEYYKLCMKKVIPLRASGIRTFGTDPPAANVPVNLNSDSLCVRFSINLTKFLPKKLKYSETPNNVTNTDTDPQNSSLFFCTAFYNQDGTFSGNQNRIMTEYVSFMKFKDT